MKTAVIYLRVSTKEQAERDADPEGYSIPAQRDACRRKAEALGAVVVEEFIDRGESAKTADRPELQRMLARLRDGRDIDYLIVHKVDRLARSRADDVSIGLALKTAGTQLVSVTENIDETPSGKLLHGIMASIAEFYSQNLASEILKGSVQKAKAGGTLSLAPLGYLNVRKVVDGREVRTVELDPERAPHVRFAFQAYATGDWSLRSLLEELSDRGLTNRATARRPERPLHLSKLAKLLTNPYYIGIVSYRGELYPGKHPPLIPAAVFDKVQAVLAAHRLSGDRRQKHHHFLKGTVLCGRCGSRLSVGYFNGNGGRYRYFFCLGRHSRRTTCDLPYLSVDEVEQAVEAHWQARVHLDPDLLERVRRNLLAELKVEHRQATKLIAQEQVRIDAIEAQRVRWAEKSAAGVIPDDIGRTKQNDLTVQLIRATHDRDELIKVATEDTRIFSDTLDLTRDCVEGYRQADDDLKRDWNQAFFEWIRVDVDRAVESKLKPPFDTLLDPTTLRYYGRPAGGAAPTKRHRDPDRVPVSTSSGAGVLVGVGSSKSLLVAVVRALSKPARSLERLTAQPPRCPDPAEPVRGAASPPIVQQPPPLSSDEVTRLLRGYKDGRPVRDLASEFGIHRNTVAEHLRRAGVERRQRGLTPDQVDEAGRLYTEGSSLACIGQQYGVDAETVRQALLKAGVSLRPRPGWTGS